MAIALTSDPIIPAADAATLLSWPAGDELNLAINSSVLAIAGIQIFTRFGFR